jgi:hypothetical protein
LADPAAIAYKLLRHHDPAGDSEQQGYCMVGYRGSVSRWAMRYQDTAFASRSDVHPFIAGPIATDQAKIRQSVHDRCIRRHSPHRDQNPHPCSLTGRQVRTDRQAARSHHCHGWSELISKPGGKIRRQQNRNAHCSQSSRRSTKISTNAIGRDTSFRPH